MNKISLYFISIVIFGILISCKKNTKPEINQAGFVNDKRYVSIDGLWRVTPETAIKFPNGTLEPIILFQTNSRGKLTAQGCFLWDNRFYDYWPLKNIQFNDSTNSLAIDYNEKGTYRGILDFQKDSIQGIAYGGDPSDTNKLDFIREEILDINKLFVPYPRGQNGSISYIYQEPKDYEDQLQTASLFDYTADSTAFYNLIEGIIKQKFGRLESLLIIKDEKLIFEEYFYGYDRSQLHHIHSCT